LAPEARKSFSWALITKIPSLNGKERQAFCSMILQKQDPIKKACLVHFSDELVKKKEEEKKPFQIDRQNMN
jgi:hypothetical protein